VSGTNELAKSLQDITIARLALPGGKPPAQPGGTLPTEPTTPEPACQASASTSNLYVSPSGSDTNPGTQTAPFKTIQKAADVVTVGTTVHVMPGTYNERVNITKSGTANARIVFISETKWGAHINYDLKANGSIIKVSGSYIDINGFEITGDTQVGIKYEGSYGMIIGNKIHGTSRTVDYDNGGAGIDVAGPNYDNHDVDIIGNFVYDIGPHNGNTSSAAHGIYCAYANGTVANNVVANATSFGIHMYHTGNNIKWVNNTVMSSSYGLGFSDGGGSVTNVFIANNISMNNQVDAFYQNGGSNITFANNLVYGNPAGAGSGYTTDDPKFVNYQAHGFGDYRLQTGSPAIDKGTHLNAPAADFDSASRPVGSTIDIGAYEYGGIPNSGCP
jgi:hypothetical protein